MHYLAIDQAGEGDSHLHSDQIKVVGVQILEVGEEKLKEDHNHRGVDQIGLRLRIVRTILSQFVRVANQIADREGLRENRDLLKVISAVSRRFQDH